MVDFVGKLSTMGQANSAFDLSGVCKWVVILVFTSITDMETIKTTA